ncbi:MAG: hypothetical protein ACHQT8_03560, partial [Chlamydiales bacterium]
VYELLHHKTDFAQSTGERAIDIDLDLGLSVLDLMKRFDERFTDHEWRAHTRRKYGEFEESWPELFTSRAAESLKTLLEKPALWNQFIKHLFENHNEFTKIRELVRRYLA